MSAAQSASILLRGTHGTSKSRANVIISGGKFASSVGLLGNGAYFWAYETEVAFAKRLAVNWWRFCTEKLGSFTTDADPSLAVLNADIEADHSTYFDANSESFKELLVLTAEQKAIDPNQDDFIKLRAVLLKEIENQLGNKFDVIKAEVPVAGRVPGKSVTPYVYLATKQASCYVVMAHALDAIKKIELIGD
jgi:hypothetical protein